MKYQLFNDNWKYWQEQNAFALVWNVPENAKTVTLPHDAMLEARANAQSPNGGNTGFRDGGAYAYVKHFTPSENDRHKTLFLKFEGVYCNAKVFINEELAGKCAYGYTGFYVPLNGFLKYGEENEIRVIVKNSGMPNSRWYSGSGIYRDVYLLSGGEVYIRPDGVQVTTKSVLNGTAALAVSTELKNRCCHNADVRLRCRVMDGEGTVAAEAVTVLSLTEGEMRTVHQNLTVRKAKLWSENTPALYSVVTELWKDETLLDVQETVTGIRTLSLDAVNGLCVNGESVKLRGACIHHDNGILGAVSCYDAERRRVRRLKDAGFNAIRMSHHPAAPALLRACDESGLYVMDEAFDMWHRCKSDNDYALFFEECWESDVTAMVRKDYNHPSVLMYSVGNEIPEIGTRHGAQTCHRLCEKIRSLDATRYTLASINGVFAAGDQMGRIMEDVVSGLSPEELPEGNVNDFMTLQQDHMADIVRHDDISRRLEMAVAATDIAGYNYMTARYADDCKTYPNRIIVGSETYPPAIADNWAWVKKLSQVIGDFTWTGWDYIGEAGVGIPAYAPGEGGFGAQFPCQLAYCGDLDITGYRRPASFFRELVFGRRAAPYIAVQNPKNYGRPMLATPWILSDTDHCWTYPGMEGKPVAVEVYSAGDEVELLLSGQSLGRAPAGDAAGFIARFDTVYQPGRLEAVTYVQGTAVASQVLETAQGPCHLVLEAEASETPDGVTYISIVKQAENGVTADSQEQITVSGDENIQILGFGSGNPKPEYNFTDNTVTLYHGRALAAVRRKNGEKAGMVQFTVSWGEASICIE